MTRIEELRYIFHTRQKQMDRKMLVEYIKLLVYNNDQLLDTLEEISSNADTRGGIGEEAEESIESNYPLQSNRDDMD